MNRSVLRDASLQAIAEHLVPRLNLVPPIRRISEEPNDVELLECFTHPLVDLVLIDRPILRLLRVGSLFDNERPHIPVRDTASNERRRVIRKGAVEPECDLLAPRRRRPRELLASLTRLFDALPQTNRIPLGKFQPSIIRFSDCVQEEPFDVLDAVTRVEKIVNL